MIFKPVGPSVSILVIVGSLQTNTVVVVVVVVGSTVVLVVVVVGEQEETNWQK